MGMKYVSEPNDGGRALRAWRVSTKTTQMQLAVKVGAVQSARCRRVGTGILRPAHRSH